MSNDNTNSSRKEFFLFRWIRRMLFPNKELDIYAEEQLQSPLRMVVRNFFSKPLSVVCLFLLIAIMLFVFIAPNYVTLDLGEQDSTLVNIAPGYDMMNLPAELEKNGVKDIGVGNNYSVGVDLQGKVYTWGKTKISKVVDVANVPEEVKRAVIVKVAAGADHVVALDDKGVVYAWGNARLGQTRLPQDLLANNVQHTSKIIDLQASNQFSAALTEDKKLFVWGNTNFVDLDVRKELQGHIVDMALTNTAFVVLLDDGSVVNPGFVSSSTITKIPEEAGSDVLNIVASTNTVAAIKKDGSVIVWGAATKGENKPPHFEAPVDYIEGGRYHFAAHLTDGNVICWGSDRYGQCDVPEEVKNAHIVSLNSGSFQNYAVDDNGKVYSWGLKGFIMGTDNLGRDVFARLVNGGKMTMTIGALSVVIEMIIGVILGGIAGYFGGWVDMVIMRVAEVISSMPFIPFAMILSAVMGTRVSVGQRMYIIMVILGILSWPGLCRLVRAQMLSQRDHL